MKRIFAVGLMVALAISSCQIKEEYEFAPEGKPFTATMESIADDAGDVETKTSMDANGNVRWKRGDQVSIFAGSTVNEHYQVTDASDGKTAAALNRVENPGFVAGGEIFNNVAFYPYDATAEIAKSGNSYVISDIALPATQNYAQASFGNGAFPMVAVTSSASDYILKFKNVLGGLKLQLKGTATITAISVTGNNNEKLCGAAAVTSSNTAAPSIALTDATAKTVTLDCGNGIQLNENTATAFIIALPPMTMSGGFTVTVTDSQNKQMEIKTTRSQTITRSDLLSMPVVTYEGTGSDPVSEPVAVDLGLPSGLKWATCNVGASAPEDYGDYFAWGETEPYYTAGHSQDSPCSNWRDNKTGYDWVSYKFRTSGDSYDNVQFSKYNTSSSYGPVDNNTVLDPEDDAATANWGGTWRMPTDAEWTELRTECAWTWTTQNRKEGYLVTSNTNGNSIFLPAAGRRYDTDLYNTASSGHYWASSLYTDNPTGAWGVTFYSDFCDWGDYDRYYGQSVRAVTDEGVRVSVTGVSLNKDSLDLAAGESELLTATVTPLNATQPNVIWSSSDASVASVDYNGKVTAVAAGTATITAKTYDGGFTATCSVTVSAFVPKAVDLGLTSGLKWASCNVGANAPEGYGDYFAWGETEPYYTAGHSQDSPCSNWEGNKTGYNWASYKWCNGSYNTQTKYCTFSSIGTVDNKTVLDPEDDAASVNWGGTWRMPTLADWQELLDECTWTWTTQNGVNGRLVTGPSGNSIFLPAAGLRYSTFPGNARSDGYYWSSSLSTDGPYNAYGVYFYSDEVSRYFKFRYYGFSVRAVTDEGVRVSVTGVSLNKNSLDLEAGESESLTATVTPSTATQPNVIWSSSDNAVATVDYTGKVTAIATGTAIITAKTYDGGFTATCNVIVPNLTPTGTMNGYGYVDLGLTSGLKWATCNVGANAPEEYGDYFAWGGTEPQGSYDWTTCPFRTSGDNWDNVTFSKYITSSDYGPIDNNTVLDTEDDAAAVNWGGTWRMPTNADWTELRTECTWTWTTLNGVNGRLVTGPNGNSIFLPAAGYRYDAYLYDAGSCGYYSSSYLYTYYPYRAYVLNFFSDKFYWYGSNRCNGQSVRAVTE